MTGAPSFTINDSIQAAVNDFYSSLSAKQKAQAIQLYAAQQAESEQARQQQQAAMLQSSQPGAAAVPVITSDPAANQVPQGVYRQL
jgi:hypothetical protein